MPTCLHPTKVKNIFYPCGNCPNCVQNKRNSLTARFVLESAFCGGPTFFVTLTYDDDHLPYFQGYPCFNKTHIQKFIKKIRHEIPNFLYFLTSEYGDNSARPHYHALFFLQSNLSRDKLQSVLDSKWKYGFTQVSRANSNRFAYACKYTLKQDSYIFKDLDNSNPRKPFRLFSSRPGIGSSAIPFINEYIFNEGNFRNSIDINGKTIIFDQYIKRHIDPSLLIELQHNNYYDKFNEIQTTLKTQYYGNVKEIAESELNKYDNHFFAYGAYYTKDYTKDNEIRNHRRKLTQLKKSIKHV